MGQPHTAARLSQPSLRPRIHRARAGAAAQTTAAMLGTCELCPICGSVDVKSTARKTITVCRCLECKAVWHVLPDTEPTAA